MLSNSPSFDEELVRRLPLPLAQLYRRAHGAREALDRHFAAYYLAEASLKLLGATAIVALAERGGEVDPDLTERLKNLARPALGHWWEFVRRLLPILAEAGDPGFVAAKTLVLGRARDDLPRTAGLDAALRETLDKASGARVTVRISELLDRLVRYRNREIGHGAAAQRPAEHYDRMGRTLLLGLAELLGRLDVLAGRRLVAVTGVHAQPSGGWLIERYELLGEAPRRLESLERPESDATRLPRPGRLYLVPSDDDAASGAQVWSLHPLVLYDHERAEVAFLNARRGRRGAEYLCYYPGRTLECPDSGDERRELLARVLGVASVGPEEAESWATRSQAEQDTQEPDEAKLPGASRRRMGEFELLSELGRGGMGVVYRAWQASLGRQVALKCLLRAGDARAEARFNREIHALGRVEHPHLVKVYTSGSEAESWFYAMELVEGATLAAVCGQLQGRGSIASELDLQTWHDSLGSACREARASERHLSTERSNEGTPSAAKARGDGTGTAIETGRDYVRHVVELVRQVAEAAHALHEAGVVHRDIKPDNVLVTPDGRQAVLMDLGLAQLADETEGRLTRTRQFVGTLRYASPEQVLSVPLDRRSDVYSLGATLWEVLTLRPLFEATDTTPTPDLMLKIQSSDPVPPRRYNPRVPADLEAIVQKCLEKERTRRYATARELAEDLDRWLNGAPVQAQPPTLGYLLGKSVRRHRVGIAVASLLVLTIVLGATAAAAINVLITVSRARDNVKKALGETRVARDEANHARHREQEAREKVETARRRIESLENERRLRLVRIAVTNGVQLREKGDVSGALAWFADALRIESDTSTPDPRREEAHRLRIASLLRQIPKLTHVFHHDDVIYEANFSRDGQSVVTASKDGTARVWDAESGQQRVILRHGEHLYGAAFSPDGRRIVTDGGNLARIWTADSGQQVAVLKLRDWAHSPATFSPDSRRLLTRSWKTAQVWDSDTGRRLAEFEQGGAGIESARFDPEGKRIIMTLDNDIIAHILDVSSGQQCAELRHDNLQRDWYADFSPDGRLAVTCCLGGKVFIWNATSGQRILSLSHGSSSGACHAEFSPDGRRLITKGSGVVRLWEVQSGRHLAEFKDVDGSIDAWSRPYARRVVTHESDGTARVRDLDSDRVLAVLRHGENVRSASFSPDGRRILTASDDGTSCIWDLASNSDEVLFSSRLTVGSVAYSRDGRHILTTQIGGGPATVWDADTGYEIAVLVHEAPLKGAEFSADGRRVLTFGGGTARVWDVHSGRSLVVLEHGKSISSARFGPDANRVVTAGWDGTAQVWDTNSRQRLVTLRHGDHVENACFSPDGRRILSISGDSLRSTLRIWEAGSGRELGRGDFEDKVSSACFNSDGSRFLTACQDGIAEVFDGESFQPLLELRGPGRLAGASFSPDGRRITTFNGGGLARLWDAMSGRLLSELKHCENMKDAVFSPDGRRVLTSGGGMATLWDVDAGQEIAVFRNQKGVFGGGFSPDGQRVVIAGGDGAASVWNLAVDGRPVGDLIRLAQLYAMTQISPIGDLVPLRTAEAMENWKALRTVYPVDFRPRSQDVLQWHRHEAITCEANQGWISPVPHLNALIKAEPGSWSLRERRSWALIPLGMWAKAADDLTRALELRPDKVDLHAWRAAAYAELGQWPPAEEDIREAINGNKQSSDPLMSLARRQRFLALIKLGQGDLPGYRMACRALLESIRDATWHYYDISAPAFVAAPDAIDDWESVFSRLRTAYKELKSNDLQRREDVGLLGMIAYRSGRTEEAIGYLGDAVAAHFPKGESAQPMRNPFDKGNLCMLPPEGGAATEWLFLAMAHQRLGHGQEGQSFLAKATLALDRIALDQPMNVSAGRILDWQDRLTLRLLRREAEKLLSKDAATPSDPET